MAAMISGQTVVKRARAKEPGPFRFSREAYYQLVSENFFAGERVELINGRIVQMSPQNYPHSNAVELVDLFVRRAFPKDHRIRIQSPLKLKPASDPEPDLAVIHGSIRGQTDHPVQAVLVVEVSDTSLAYDRKKARLYARNGITDYWIVNLIEQTLEVYREPLPGGGQRGGPAYGNVRIYRRDETIAPLGAPEVATIVSELLP